MTLKGAKNRHLTYLLALSVITLAVYLQALNAGFLSVDDTDTIRYIQSGNVSLTGLFLEPGRAYYRPLALLSLLTDFQLFGGNPAGYHLTNLLLHLANVLLVYYLATLLMGKERYPGIFPFLAALLFAVHPVNSEAVVWISARPDLLCCFFFLLCMVLLVKGSGKVTPLVFTGLFVTFLCSLASKEASLLLPVLALAYFLLERKNIPARNGVAACTALFLAALVNLMLRKGLPIAPVPGLAASMQTASHATSSFIDGAAACGFYFRKLLYPFPLNIAITDIPVNTCIVIFLLGCALSVVMWIKDTSLRFPLLFLAGALIPPLGALFLSLPWTPYAERYLYLPSIAFALGTTNLLHRHTGWLPPSALVVCMMLAAIPTAYRVNMWTKPIAFWQDAVAKSPKFGTLRLPLAAEYIEAGRYAEAENSLQQADKLGLPLKGARDFSRQLESLLMEKRKGSLPVEKESRRRDLQPVASGAPPRQTR
jgi:hypothetical protein